MAFYVLAGVFSWTVIASVKLITINAETEERIKEAYTRGMVEGICHARANPVLVQDK